MTPSRPARPTPSRGSSRGRSIRTGTPIRGRSRPARSRLGLGVVAVVTVATLAMALGATGVLRGGGATHPSGPLPGCSVADLVVDAGYGDWATTVLDTAYRLPPGYEPPDLAPIAGPGIAGSGTVRELVLEDLRALGVAAEADGAALRVVSAYRSETTQADVFAEEERTAGHEAALAVSARPGHSEHQLGTAIDFGSAPGGAPWDGDWGRSPEGEWLAANADRFGFVLSYPANASPARTCYSYEPWHYRYVGRDLAARIRASGLAPREFLWTLD